MTDDTISDAERRWLEGALDIYIHTGTSADDALDQYASIITGIRVSPPAHCCETPAMSKYA